MYRRQGIIIGVFSAIFIAATLVGLVYQKRNSQNMPILDTSVIVRTYSKSELMNDADYVKKKFVFCKVFESPDHPNQIVYQFRLADSATQYSKSDLECMLTTLGHYLDKEWSYMDETNIKGINQYHIKNGNPITVAIYLHRHDDGIGSNQFLADYLSGDGVHIYVNRFNEYAKGL